MYNPKIIETLTDRITRDMKSGVRAKIAGNKRAATYKTFAAVQIARFCSARQKGNQNLMDYYEQEIQKRGLAVPKVRKTP